MSIKQAIEALEVAQDALDISQSLQESAKSNHHPKTLAAYERVSAALAALRSMPAEPVATIRYERGTPGKENDMPKVVSCNWLPDGVYSVYATPHTEAVRMSEAEINHLVDTHVGGPTPSYPLGPEDWINFARAVEQATAARLGVKMGDV